MTYPKLLGRIPPHLCNRSDQKNLVRNLTRLGEIDSEDMAATDPVRDALQLLCRNAGFKFSRKQPAPYALFDHTTGAGSAFIHTDPGMGLTAAVLVATLPLWRGQGCDIFGIPTNDICQLITRTGEIDIGIGQAFVFNADKPHAWVANCRWVLAVQHVRRGR